jgi:hypothetical protein
MNTKGNLDTGHPFHLVDPSPWPLIASAGAFAATSGGVMYFHGYSGGGLLHLIGMFTILFTMYTWWRDIVREGTFEGQHTAKVQEGLSMGMILFITSEVMFFFAFFWAFFHSSIAPSIELGSQWPPLGIETFSAWEVPFFKYNYITKFRSHRYMVSPCYCSRRPSRGYSWTYFHYNTCCILHRIPSIRI